MTKNVLTELNPHNEKVKAGLRAAKNQDQFRRKKAQTKANNRRVAFDRSTSQETLQGWAGFYKTDSQGHTVQQQQPTIKTLDHYGFVSQPAAPVALQQPQPVNTPHVNGTPLISVFFRRADSNSNNGNNTPTQG